MTKLLLVEGGSATGERVMAEGQQKKEVSKQPALSSRLMQMKFMQRGKEKTVLKEAAAEQVFSSLIAPRAYLSYVTLQCLHLRYHTSL